MASLYHIWHYVKSNCCKLRDFYMYIIFQADPISIQHSQQGHALTICKENILTIYCNTI